MNKRIAIFYAIWAVLGAIQAYTMELADDEAYYWVCGQFLEWGSYHTPPLIPFLSQLGYSFFHNEFGVRLFYWLLHILTLILIERLTKPKDVQLFIVIISSFLVIHVAGFWAVPDIPYLFFTSLLVLLFERFSIKSSLLNALLLALSLSLLIYSKYHAAVVIGALVLANTQLFKKRNFYIAGLLCILFLLPHLHWLWKHDFITVTFHWQERDHHGYNWYYPFHYIMSLLLIAGPLIGLILIIPTLRLKPSSQRQKNLKYIFVGIIGFFFLLSFRNRIEANWMVAAIVPLMILGYKAAEDHSKIKKWIYYSFPISLLLAIFCRIVLTVDVLPRDKKMFSKLNEFHGNKVWVQQLKQEAGSLPVVFQYSHQLPAKYMFYSGQENVGNITPHTSLSSSFELLHPEEKFHGQKILSVQGIPSPNFREVKTQRSNFFIKEKDPFCHLSHVKIIATPDANISIQDSAVVPIRIPNLDEIDFDCPDAQTVQISYYFSQHNKYLISEMSNLKLLDFKAGNDTNYIKVKLPQQKGKYLLSVALVQEDIIPTHNSKRVPVQITD